MSPRSGRPAADFNAFSGELVGRPQGTFDHILVMRMMHNIELEHCRCRNQSQRDLQGVVC
jgi:hypothetical protein